MAQFTMTVDTGNAAFAYGDDSEVRRLLLVVLARFDSGKYDGKLIDANGNTVGEFGFTDTAEDGEGGDSEDRRERRSGVKKTDNRAKPNPAKRRGRVSYVVIERDPGADQSWLKQSCYDPNSPDFEHTYRSGADARNNRNPYDPEWYRDPANHVALRALAYDESGKLVDSLHSIDFLADSDDWKTGTIRYLSELPRRSYLRSVCRDLGLHKRSPRRSPGKRN